MLLLTEKKILKVNLSELIWGITLHSSEQNSPMHIFNPSYLQYINADY